MPEENQNENLQEAREPFSGGAVKKRAGSGGIEARPLSQFILAKQTERLQGNTGFSANIEPIRPVVITAPVRQAGTKSPFSGRSARRHSPMRVEYPFYAEGEDELNFDDFPLFEDAPPADSAPQSVQGEPAAPKIEVSESAAAELAVELNSARPVSAACPAPAAVSLSSPPPAEPAPFANTPQIRVATVPAAETAVPLLCDRGRSDSLPIFRCYLASESAR